MTETLVIMCNECGGLMLAKTEQKTRACPYCGSKVHVEKARILGTAENAFEASELLRRLKKKDFEKKRANDPARR